MGPFTYPWLNCCLLTTLSGLSNKFLNDSKDPIVAQYGPDSTNETMHAAITTTLIKKYELLPAHLTEPVCSVIKEIILKTDMAVSISSLTALVHIAVSASNPSTVNSDGRNLIVPSNERQV
jgi:hypothetical protein